MNLYAERSIGGAVAVCAGAMPIGGWMICTHPACPQVDALTAPADSPILCGQGGQAAAITVGPLIMSVPARSALMVALGLHRLRSMQARSVWTAMYFLPFEVSLVAAALIWQWMYDPLYGLALMASLSPASARKA